MESTSRPGDDRDLARLEVQLTAARRELETRRKLLRKLRADTADARRVLGRPRRLTSARAYQLGLGVAVALGASLFCRIGIGVGLGAGALALLLLAALARWRRLG